MAIHVTSEIGQLKRVPQRPGRELEHLSPETMEQLLFDDIPNLHRAQAEHDRFAELLRESGAEVSYLDSLIAEVLEKKPALREPFVSDVIEKAGGSARGLPGGADSVSSVDAGRKNALRKTMAGVTYEGGLPGPRGGALGAGAREDQISHAAHSNLYLRATRLPASAAA